MGKQIRDVMSANPRAVEPATPITDAAKLMKQEDVGALPVVEGDRLVGMVTDRDIVVRAVADGGDVASKKVRDVATKSVEAVEPDQPLDEALRRMATAQVRRLPVVEDGKLVGIVAQADIARHEGAEKTGELVEEISQG